MKTKTFEYNNIESCEKNYRFAGEVRVESLVQATEIVFAGEVRVVGTSDLK